MATREEISKLLNKYKDVATSILIDDFGYNIHQIIGVSEDTQDTDDIMIAYTTSYDYWNEQVIADTHFITLNDLLGADTIILSADRPIEVLH